MAYRTSTHSLNLRQSSSAQSSASAAQSAALQQRIHEKRIELENLKQLCDLSGGLAGQMEQLEAKLKTLSTGTEAVAAVMSNWHHVLSAISMAATKLPRPSAHDNGVEASSVTVLPETLVRIPIQGPATLAGATSTAEANGD